MILRVLIASSLIAIAAAAQPPAADDPSSSFPPGRGRDTMLRVCSGCHGIESAIAQYRSHEDWVKALEEMGNNGAQASDREWDDILAYIDHNFSRIFINKATQTELETMLGVDATIAEAVVRRRTEKGEFASIDDLKTVPGLAADIVDARRERFIF